MQIEKLHNQIFFLPKSKVQIVLKFLKLLFSLEYFLGVYPVIFAVLYPTDSPEYDVFLELTSFSLKLWLFRLLKQEVCSFEKHVFLILLFVKWAVMSVQAFFIFILQFTEKGDTAEHRLPLGVHCA